jgi:hypothetical protein
MSSLRFLFSCVVKFPKNWMKSAEIASFVTEMWNLTQEILISSESSYLVAEQEDVQSKSSNLFRAALNRSKNNAADNL